MEDNIAIVGDLHARDTIPRKRQDNFIQTCIAKLTTLLTTHKYVLILGDFFDKPNISIECLNELILFLSPYRGRIFSLIGNHDAYYRTASMSKTALGLLSNIGLITIVDQTTKINGVSFDVASVVPKLELPEQKSDILLGHFYLENNFAPSESLTKDELQAYKYVFLGHDHSPYYDIVHDNTTIIRTGSLTRTDAQDYQLDRKYIRYSTVSEDAVTGEYVIDSDRRLDIKPASEVFIQEVFEKPTVKRISCDLSSLDELISKFKKQDGKDDGVTTSTILKDISTPKKCYDYLQLTHENLGLRF